VQVVGRMSREPSAGPGAIWLVGVLVAAVLTGGVTVALTDGERGRTIETVIRDTVVLPEGQAEVTGTVTGFVADDANGPPLSIPLEIATGRATIDGALVDGRRSSIVWDGGRPLRLRGEGAVDLGPTHVEMGVGALFWPIDGIRVLAPGSYRIDTPVAVGAGGLAHPEDAVSFTADGETTIETAEAASVVRGLGQLHLEGPGSLRADGAFTIKTRDGTATRTHLEFGPGSFVFDLAPDKTFTATFNGPLTSS
jgi:hypothetical protein